MAISFRRVLFYPVFNCSRILKNVTAVPPSIQSTRCASKKMNTSLFIGTPVSRSFCSIAEFTGEDDSLYKKIRIEVKGHDVPVLNSYEKFVKMVADELDINIDKIYTPPRVMDRLSLLKSVHVYKKHFVQYEMRTNYRTIEVSHLTGSTAEIFLEYVQRNLPEGVAMKVTKTKIEELPDHLRVVPESQAS